MISDNNKHKNKIFQIGLNKCGTVSLEKFFEGNGFRTKHGGRGGKSVPKFQEQVQENLKRGKPIFHKNDHDVYLDLPSVITYFKKIDEDYPQSYFILNTRPLDKWLLSRMNHAKGEFCELVARRCKERNEWWCNYFHGNKVIPAMPLENRGQISPKQLISYWTQAREEHHQNIIQYFANRPNDLLVFDIENDSIEKVISFLKPTYNLSPRHWGHKHRTKKVWTMKDLKNLQE